MNLIAYNFLRQGRYDWKHVYDKPFAESHILRLEIHAGVVNKQIGF